jgi:hypothetical protein
MMNRDGNTSLAVVEPDPPLHDDKVETNLSKSESALNFAFLSFLGFTILQFMFAEAARSDAMLADCAGKKSRRSIIVNTSYTPHLWFPLFIYLSTAMTVDAMTYLFNYGAERMKHRIELNSDDDEWGDDDNNNPQTQGPDENKRELQRLLLELIPPSISASTLMVVTILTMAQSIQDISTNTSKENPPDIAIMLIFSALNLVLDGFNVLEFSKVDHVILSVTNVHHEHARHFHHHHHPHGSVPPTEATQLLADDEDDDDDVISHSSMATDLNLNMCSAWTHIAADTLRSIAVLVAASFSALFPHLLSPIGADSLGAILVSIVILISLFPLIQGIYNTAGEIRRLRRQQRN